MHNLPINNETNLIRNILNRSLHENFAILEAAKGGKSGKGGKEGKGAKPSSKSKSKEEIGLESIERKLEEPSSVPEATPEPTSKKAPTEKQLNWRLGGGTDPVTGERITIKDRTVKDNILKYGSAAMGAAMLGGTVGLMATSMADDSKETGASPVKSNDLNFTLPPITTGDMTNYGRDLLKKTENKTPKPVNPPASINTPITRTPIMPGSVPEINKQLQPKSSGLQDLLKTIRDITTGSAPESAPASTSTTTPAKLPEQPMDKAVQEYKNRKNEEEGMRDMFPSSDSAPARPKPSVVSTPKPAPVAPAQPKEYNYPDTFVGSEKAPSPTKETKPAEDPRGKRMGSADVVENGKYIRREVYKDSSGKMVSYDTELQGTPPEGLGPQKRNPAVGPPGGYAGQGLRDWQHNKIPPKEPKNSLPVFSSPKLDSPKVRRPGEVVGPIASDPRLSIYETYYNRLANLFEETRDSLEDISAKRRERQVQVAGLKGEINPHGFVDLVKGMKNLRAFSGMGGGDMPKDRIEKASENIGERTVAKADQRKALMTIMSASQDHPDLKDRFTKEDALNPHSPLHKMLVSRNPNLRDESQIMAKYHIPSRNA
jgi:hypothetical protein